MIETARQDLEAFTEQVVAYHRSFGKEFWRLLWAAVRELATGKPVDPEDLATLANLPLDRTLAIAREGRLEWDPDGKRLIGVGLTSLPTPYRIDINGRVMWTYCAPDALQLPVILRESVRTRSACAATGAIIRVYATPTGIKNVDPPSAVVSFPDPSMRPGLANVRETGCNQASFYRDNDAGVDWLAANPHGRLLSVPDAFTVLRTSMLRIRTWSEQPVG